MKFSEEFISFLLEKMTCGFALHKVLTGKEGNPKTFEYLEINQAYEALTGLKKENLIGKTVLDIGNPEDEDLISWNQMLCNFVTGTPVTDVIKYSKLCDQWYNISCFIPEEGYLAAILFDVTYLKEQEQKLHKSHEELQKVFNEQNNLYQKLIISGAELKQTNEKLIHTQEELGENERRLKKAQEIAKIGNWELDLETDTFWASDEAFRLYGISVDTSNRFYENVRKIHKPDTLKVLDEAINALIYQDILVNVKYELEFPDGTKRYLHSLAEAQKDKNGKPKRLLGTLRDITEEVLYENQLHQKNEEVTSLYEEVLASEEELRQQNDELFQKNDEIVALYEELTSQDEELRANYEQLTESMERLRKSEEINQLIIDTVSEGVWQYDLIADKYMISPQFVRALGYEPEEMNNIQKLTELTHEEDREAAINTFNYHTSGETDRYNATYRLRRKDGTYMWVKATGKIMRDLEGKEYLMAGSFSDLTELKAQQDKLEYLAYHDTLTGLPNRNRFLIEIEKKVKNSERLHQHTAIIFMDLDNFKTINDTLGYDVGDRLLQDIATRLSNYVNKQYLLARLSGDEFALILDYSGDTNEVYCICSGLKEYMAEPFELDGYCFYISSSMGVALYPYDGISSKELLKSADMAMYYAKSMGKNSIHFFNKNMQADAFRRLLIENRLKTAIKEKVLTLHYQPQYYLKSGKIRAFEALLRWTDHELGTLSPVEFIPIAENSGLIVPLGEWILHEACRQANEFNQLYKKEVLMSVNISAIQLKQPNFVSLVKQILTETGLPGNLLELEVTETTMISSFDHIIPMFCELRELGIKISLDDFGTGYSSLNYLKKLPLDALKIDKSFIYDIANVAADRDITSAIISLVHGLQIEVIAEGVETKEQLMYLHENNCDTIQGFLMSRPVPALKAHEIIKSGNASFHMENSNN